MSLTAPLWPLCPYKSGVAVLRRDLRRIYIYIYIAFRTPILPGPPPRSPPYLYIYIYI